MSVLAKTTCRPADSTGRITGSLSPTARGIVFGAVVDTELDTDLPYSATVDLAHVVMLERAGLLDRETAAALACAVEGLRANGFAPLRGRHAPRGAYLLYESWLIDRTGMNVGGKLHIGRSRNDLKATVLRLRLRERLRELLGETSRLSAVLLSVARRHRETVMPAFTQYQPAVPITYGHWLLGAATAVGRHLRDLAEAERTLDECPLGAGAIGGTELPIDPALTARLLGFDRPAGNSVDAVAARDHVPRTLAAAAGLATTMSRLAGDLLLWSTAERPLLTLPDELVGSSSAMPQKRNPFLLEHVRAKSAHVVGAWTAASGAMHGVPFGNSVEVGTEGVAPAWAGLDTTEDAVILLRLVVTLARPDPDAMAARAESGGTTATALANRLTEHGVPFRLAHRVVGAAVAEAGPLTADGLVEAVRRHASDLVDPGALAACTPADVAASANYGGGPGLVAFDAAFARLATEWRLAVSRLAELRARAARADTELASAVAELTGVVA